MHDWGETRRLLSATADRDGCHPQTAAEWLAWRDGQVEHLRLFKTAIAAVMPMKLYENPPPEWWREATVQAVAAAFQKAEFMVWEDPQWQEVVRQSPAFCGSMIQVPAAHSMLWTWPGDRRMESAARAAYGVPDGFNVGAILVFCLPDVPAQRAAALRERVAGVPMEGLPFSGPEFVNRLLNTDVTIALYCTVDDRSVPEEWWRSLRERAQRAAFDPLSLAAALPRLVVLPHQRNQAVSKGWEIIPAALGFLRERIYVPEPMPQSRQQRRHYERSHPDCVSRVQVISLRRAESRAKPEGAGAGREYQCRWWVGGHWRRRAEKWQQGEGPIFVRPYVKGPQDAPLKPKESRIVRVER